MSASSSDSGTEDSGTEDRLAAAIQRLSEGEGLSEAEQTIARVAPELRVALAEALASGGWFGQSHDAETLKVATIPDDDRRLEAVRALLTEETNIGMMVGVAVGWALRAELDRPVVESERGGS
jgi:hypothetical protein